MHQPDIDGERRHHENHPKNQTFSLLVGLTLGIIDSAVNNAVNLFRIFMDMVN